MPSFARREIVAEGERAIYHCTARCVRHAFLCGRDPVSGRDYEHRKNWIHGRLEFLAGVFALDVCGFAVMGDRIHVVLRTRPDVCQQWSDREIARRWWRLFPRRREEDGAPAEPNPHELLQLLESDAALAERRKRLASVSWFMRTLCEPIARRANREDECGGRFWEGRFKCLTLLDEAAVLACSLYVDLNPLLTGLATAPEASAHTSALDRLAARQARLRLEKQRKVERGVRAPKKKRRSTDAVVEPQDGWLCPIPDIGKSPSLKSSKAARASRRRASDCGFLPMELDAYLRLLD